jgi:hypothetical protein
MVVNTLEFKGVTSTELRALTAEFKPGIHIIRRRDSHGLSDWFALLSGMKAPRHGTLLVRGRAPFSDPELRTHIGTLWPEERKGQGGLMTFEELRKLGLTEKHIESSLATIRAFGAETNGPIPAQLNRLSVALSTVAPYLLALHEPLEPLAQSARGIVIERLLALAPTIPVLLVAAEPSLYEALGHTTFEWNQGFLRVESPIASEWHLVRVVGLGLRALNGELSKRPFLRSLRYVLEPSGQEVLWVETRDPKQLSLDIVRIARQIEFRLFSLQTSVVAP